MMAIYTEPQKYFNDNEFFIWQIQGQLGKSKIEMNFKMKHEQVYQPY